MDTQELTDNQRLELLKDMKPENVPAIQVDVNATEEPRVPTLALETPGELTIEPYEPKDGTDVPRFCEKEMLAICGTADPTRGMAPYEDDSYEIWGVAVASTYGDVGRIDVQFEMHTEKYWQRDPNVCKRLAQTKVPIYMHKKYEDIPTSLRYPVELITRYRRYITNSIAYMQALAYHSFLVTGLPKHVVLFGVHMEAREEYTEQRPCCEYWLGRMEGAGMDIDMPPGGALLASIGLYGYENYNPVCWDLRQYIFGLQHGIQQSQGELNKWNIQKAKNEGGMAVAEYWLRKFQRGEYR